MTSGSGVSNRSGASSRYLRFECLSEVASTPRRIAAASTVAIPLRVTSHEISARATHALAESGADVQQIQQDGS